MKSALSVPLVAALALGGAVAVTAAPASAANPELRICTNNIGGSGASKIEARWEPPKDKAPQWTTLYPKVINPDYKVCAKTSTSATVKYKTKIKLGEYTYGVKFDPNGTNPRPRVCVYVVGRFTPDCTDKTSAGVKVAWTEMESFKYIEVPVTKPGWKGTNLRLYWRQFRNQSVKEDFKVYVCQTKTLNDDDWPCTNV